MYVDGDETPVRADIDRARSCWLIIWAMEDPPIIDESTRNELENDTEMASDTSLIVGETRPEFIDPIDLSTRDIEVFTVS
mmetsp:Transcript_6345/g.23900  ORF Transcript_6345/g.23900 Transcript_6345/m.23900 type:complete len:80 (+) Transcript_6345:2015-2254(+)